MKHNLAIILMLLAVCGCSDSPSAPETGKSTRKERLLIKDGNKSYNEGKYAPAAEKYQAAIAENPSSLTAVYDLGLTRVRQSAQAGEKEEERQKLEQEGQRLLETVSQAGNANPALASKAAYNLGNLAFNSEKYDVALQQYKRALRFNPDDDDARRNLRITQKKLQNQDQDQNQDNDKEQDQDKDKDKEEQQEKDQNQQENQDQQQNEEQQQPQQPQSRLSEQTAAQILQAVENKENATRARVNSAGEKASQRSQTGRNW